MVLGGRRKVQVVNTQSVPHVLLGRGQRNKSWVCKGKSLKNEGKVLSRTNPESCESGYQKLKSSFRRFLAQPDRQIPKKGQSNVDP